jgi:hypothetical protein
MLENGLTSIIVLARKELSCQQSLWASEGVLAWPVQVSLLLADKATIHLPMLTLMTFNIRYELANHFTEYST